MPLFQDPRMQAAFGNVGYDYNQSTAQRGLKKYWGAIGPGQTGSWWATGPGSAGANAEDWERRYGQIGADPSERGFYWTNPSGGQPAAATPPVTAPPAGQIIPRPMTAERKVELGRLEQFSNPPSAPASDVPGVRPQPSTMWRDKVVGPAWGENLRLDQMRESGLFPVGVNTAAGRGMGIPIPHGWQQLAPRTAQRGNIQPSSLWEFLLSLTGR